MVYDTVYFNGSGSTDTPSGIQSYSWDFGDGSPAGSGAAPSHAYDTAQNCTVNLTVTDRAGNAGKDSMLVQVKAKPVAQIDSIMPNPATQGQAVAFNGSGIDDGWITAYNWSSSIDGFLNGSGNFTSNLLSAGSHAISLLVKDNDNFWSDPATTGLNVYEPPGWGMFRRSALHDGATSAAYLTPENPYSLLWKNDNISANVSSPAIANIDMDWTNGLEVVAGSSDGKVYAFNSSGGLLWTYAAGGAINSTPAIADLDNNPGNGLEAVAGSDNSSIFALNSTGGMLWSYPAGGAVTSSPAIEDIDNDGSLEIAAGSNDSRLYVIESNGTLKCSYQAQGAIDSSPAIGDIDAGVAGLEIAFGSDDSSVYVIDSSCNLLASFATAGAVDSSPALGDINGDGILEIVVGSDDFNIYALGYTPGPPAALAVFWSFATNGPVDSSPALATYEYGMQWIIAAGSDDTNVYALNQNGAQLAGSPFGTGAAVDSSPAIVELNSTLWGPEVVVGSDTNALLIMNFFTNPAAVSFVYMTKNPMDPSPAVGDINHDGDLEIAAASSSLYVLHQKPVFNIQPSPNPNGPYHVQPGHGTILDGSMSFDPNEAEGDFIAKHEWNLDTDPVFEKSGELVGLTWYDIIEEVCHGYCIPGMHYPVMLRVTDSFNASSEATTAIMIQ
jgi:PKD repeat protein